MQRSIAPLTSKQPSAREGDTTFKLFPRLPAELRIIVWQLALSVSTPRVVICRHTEQDSTEIIVPLRHPTAILQVNRESQTEAFRALRPYKRDNPPTRPVIYADIDFIWFTDDASFCEFFGHGANVPSRFFPEPGLRNIVIEYHTWSHLYNYLSKEKSGDGRLLELLFVIRCICALGVHNLTIVVDGNNVSRKSDILFVEPEKSPLHSGHAMIGSYSDWKTMENEITKNIRNWQSQANKGLIREDGVSEINLMENRAQMAECCEGWDMPRIRFMKAKIRA